MAIINGSIFDDVLQGTAADDQISGFGGNDFLNGGGGGDTIFGDGGNDYIIGNTGISIISGGTGVDFIDYSFLNTDITFVVTGVVDKGNAGFDAFTGVEAIIGAPGFENTISGLTGLNDPISFNLNLTTKSLIVNGLPGVGTQGFTVDNFVNAIGTDLNDSIVGNALDNIFDGRSGDDVIFGEGGNDIILGGFGNDALNGGFGDDFLIGEFGNDLIFGGFGTDIIGGGFGADSLFGEFGDDLLLGEEGNDTLSGGAGTDILGGDSGNDFLIGYGFGIEEFDLLTGGTGADAFFLGDSNGAYYLDLGFATILDFNSFEGDSIVVGGNPGSYSFGYLDFFGTSALDALIFSNNELIGIVQDAPTVNASNLIFA